MNISKRALYAAGEPLGESVTRAKPFGRIYGGGGGGGESSSSTAATVPDELKPAATALSNMATRLGNTPYQAYGGQGVADLNAMQQAAMGLTAERALNGSQTINNAEGALNQFIQGGNTNPYLDSMVQRAQDSVKSNFNTAQINSGSFGNSGLQQSLARGLGDVSSQMYGQAYDTDRNRQMQAIGQAQQFGNQAYQDASQLFGMGQQAQNNTQDKLDFGYQQYLNAQDYPLKQMQALTGVLGQNMGSTTTTTQSGGGK